MFREPASSSGSSPTVCPCRGGRWWATVRGTPGCVRGRPAPARSAASA